MYQPNVAEKGLGVLHAYKVKCCNFAFLQRRAVRRISDIGMMISTEKAFVDNSPGDSLRLFL